MTLTVLPPPTSSAGGYQSALMAVALHVGARTVVVLRGAADRTQRPVLCDMLCRVIALQVGDVVLDLSQVTSIDTAAVRALAMGNQLLDSQGRRLIFRSPSRLVAQVIDSYAMTDLIEVPGAATA
jgi:anti-anti-sigma factor